MEKKKYYVGLDIGTNSVGWAVTDDQYSFYKFKGHKMWGVRLFEEAKTAEARRIQRASRRRLQRRNARIDLLQELMAKEIFKVDPGFYQRLKDSKFYLEDKSIQEKHTLFVGDSYNDIDFYKEFPTIFHLRLALMKTDKEYDVRLVYLALHHILKNRGHFLYQGDKFDTGSSIEDAIIEILNDGDIVNDSFKNDSLKINATKTILLNKKTTRTDKKKEIAALFQKDKQLTGIFSLSVGTKERLNILFADEEYKDLDSKMAGISFKESIYEEVREGYEEVLGERILLIDKIKKLYDSILLTGIKKEGLSLSESKIEDYKKHKEELAILKKILRGYSKGAYKKMFSVPDKNIANYKNYIGDGEKKCGKEEFYSYVKSTLEDLEESEEIKNILQEIALEKYMPLQRTKENGVIPYQIHLEELQIILDNASKYLNFLNESDGQHTIKEKIEKIMTFRIPYFVGPINTYHSIESKKGFAWAVKKSDEKIYPWNFEDVINLEASHDKFIRNMTNKCTYLKGKDVIAKYSLLYSEYMLLNELNNLRINGEKISVELRDKIIDNFFKSSTRRGKVTIKKLQEFIVSEGEGDKNITITGIDGEVKQDLKSYRDFKAILGEKFNYSMVEDIIHWLTIYSEEKKHVEKRIAEKYPGKLSKEELKRILGLTYNDWGRFSKEYLTEIFCEELTDYSTGEKGSIISAMRNTTLNQMQLMSNQYTYQKQIDDLNKELYGDSEELRHEMLDDLYVSPAVKRMIWQSLLITEEIKKLMGGEPEKIFIETVRTNLAEKRRTSTRKQRLIELYTACKEESRDWKTEIVEKTDGQLRSKKLYLYYMQMGKCMYSGEIIDLDKLMRGEFYDIDHIYPRSKIKDDSFDNLVLVKSELNREKTDSYPIDSITQDKMKNYWDFLYSKGFLSTRKYERLVRKDGFKDNELADFINRQIVETSQSTKAVADIMKRIYEDVDLMYVKAENVSDFRKQMDFIKVREINDFHHAHDAYLNIVVGNVYDTKFTKSPINFIKNAENRTYSLNRMFDFNVVRKNYTAWDGRDGNCIKRVKAEMGSNDIRVTRKAGEQKGQLFDLTVYGKDIANKESYVGMKNNDTRLADVTKYGGVTSLTIAYLMPTNYKIKNTKGIIKEHRRLVAIPLILLNNMDDWEKLEEFAKSQIKLKGKEELVDFQLMDIKLKIGSLIKYNGFYYRVGGRTGDNFCADNAIALILDKKDQEYIKEIYKYVNIKKINRDIAIDNFSDVLSRERNLELYNDLIEKMNTPIYRKSSNSKYEILNDEEKRNAFINLCTEEQIGVLQNVLNLLTNKLSTYDFKALGFGVGRRKIGFNFSDAEEFKLINQSITGLHENVIDLLE